MEETGREFSDMTVNPDPFAQFSAWQEERSLQSYEEPGTCVLATAGSDLRISARAVLIREITNEGFIFYTNYTSHKGKQIRENPYGSLVFLWPEVHRQVRIEGDIEKVAENISDQYFSTRPRGNQLTAWASDQSRPVPYRGWLDLRVEGYRKRFEGSDVPRPRHWGGYILKPVWFEFWQEGRDRRHDRVTYSLDLGVWKIEMLAP